jgi:hypothetical protein
LTRELRFKKVQVLDDGVVIAEREGINFKEGSGISFNIVDNPTNNMIDIEITAAGQGEPHHEEAFLVFLDISTWKARNGDTGNIDSSNSNPATVINYALSNLNGSRLWKELVIIKGDV